MVLSPIALVGAIGEACGEASRVLVSGTPPFLGGCLHLILRIVIISGHKKSTPCGVLCVCGGLEFHCRACDAHYGFVDCGAYLSKVVDGMGFLRYFHGSTVERSTNRGDVN